MCLTLENNLRRMPRVARSTCVGSSHELEREPPGPEGQHRLGAARLARNDLRPSSCSWSGASIRSCARCSTRYPARPDRPPDDRSINAQRPNEGLKLAEEKPIPDEEAHVASIISSFDKQMRLLWKPGGFERGGNTKTHGIVPRRVRRHEDRLPKLRHGIYAEPRTYRAWVRFSGPGPYVTPDIDDVGFMSISIKLMGVPGPKLMDEEKFTLGHVRRVDADLRDAGYQGERAAADRSFKNAQIFHFLNFRQPHVLDLVMQGLWIKTQSSPFEAPYFSCVPYLLGEGQAMQYSVWPKSEKRTRIPRLPFRPPDDYLRDAMVAALARGRRRVRHPAAAADRPHLMPIENNGVYWPERLSPRVSVATLRLPRQKFDSKAQMEFAKRLSYNPWHTIAEHRPLGNQSRARAGCTGAVDSCGTR